MTDRDDWLEWRRQGIGGSDIAALMGISSWASPWSVWADKCGLLPPEPENEYMTAGRWLERAIGPWFTDLTGLHVAGEQAWCTHAEKPWARCTPDGFVCENSDPYAEPLGTFEVKVTGPGKRWDPVPPYYQAQGQWQMFVTGLPKCWFAVLHGRRLEVYELDRDDADIEFMVERAECFWRDHVLAGVPPATDASDATARALAAVYPKPIEGEGVEVDESLITNWRTRKDVLSAYQASVDDAENQIKALLGNAEEGTVDGRRVVSWRTQERAEYTVKANSFRVLRYHPPKEKP